MGYEYQVNDHHKELINKAVTILNDLGAPISTSVLFKYMRESARYCYGICGSEKLKPKYDHDYVITLNKRIIYDDDFINTVIHELLHTIYDKKQSSHKGEWEKWAQIVSTKTKYQIRRVWEIPMDLPPLPVVETTTCYCPLCNKKYDNIPIKCISNHKTHFFCKECNKELYDVLPDSIIRDKTTKERSCYIKQRIDEGMSWDEILDVLPYASKEDTRRIVKYAVRNFDICLVDLKLYEYVRKDKVFLKEMATDYCNGVYDNLITDKNYVFFEGLWALTDHWDDVTKHTKILLGEKQESK